MAMEIKEKPLKKQTDTIPLKMRTVGKWMHIGWTKKKKKQPTMYGRKKIWKGNIALRPIP